MIRSLFLAALYLCLSLTAGAMDSIEKPSTDATSNVTTNATTDTSEIAIGVLAPLSGPQMGEGTDTRNGFELAAGIVNGEHQKASIPFSRIRGLPGLSGAKIRLVYADDQGNRSLGAAEAERLISEENVVALIGSYSSDVTDAASEVAEREGVPFICPISSTSGLTKRGYRWFFRTGPSSETFVENLFDFLGSMREDEDGFKISLLTIDNIYGNDFRALVIQEALERGYGIAADVSYEPEDSDLKGEVEQLESAGEAVLIQASYLQDAILSVQTYKQLNYTPLAIIADDAGFIENEFLGELRRDAEGIISRETWSVDSEKNSTTTINNLYRDLYGSDMNGNSARAFMGLVVLADALNRSGSTEPDAIRMALLETNISEEEVVLPWKGVSFDPKTQQNDLSRSILVQVQGGMYRTVWPSEDSVAEPIWPFPGWGDALI